MPNEVLLLIIESVESYDIESFALCNKQIYGLPEKAVGVHQDYKKKYGSIECGANYHGRSARGGSYHPTLLLKAIITNERFALYPRTLRLNKHAFPADDEVKCREIKEFLEKFEDQVKRRFGPEILQKRVLEQCQTAALMFAVMFLPNLEVIVFGSSIYHKHLTLLVN